MKKIKKQALQWETANPGDVILKDIPFAGNLLLRSLPLQEPVDYFWDIVSDKVICILEDSNRYIQFIGILFLMSVVRMPATCDYWEWIRPYDHIASCMTI